MYEVPEGQMVMVCVSISNGTLEFTVDIELSSTPELSGKQEYIDVLRWFGQC